VEHRIAEVAGGEEQLLLVPQVRLSVLADEPVGTDEHRGIE
jgi:hypothetical protein